MKSKMAAEVRQTLAAHCKMCVLCPNYLFDEGWPLVQRWHGKEAHLDCVLKQPIEAFTENYLSMIECPLPAKCAQCTYPIVTCESLRAMRGDPLHAWCLPERVRECQRRVGQAAWDDEWPYWKKVLSIEVPVQAQLQELLVQLPIREDRLGRKIGRLRRAMRVEGRLEILDLLATCPQALDVPLEG